MHQVVIIGGGPAGATAGSILAMNGIDVLILERERFPRFHIGESLLPANNKIFQRLGLADQMDENFLLKPGGKWVYGDTALSTQFSACEKTASFTEQPYSYMVERARFDEMLLEQAKQYGCDVRQGVKVTDLIQGPNGRIGGVVGQTAGGESAHFPAEITLDCSGSRAFVSSRLGQRRANEFKRMAVYGHFQTELLDKELRSGWFVGQVLKDAWVWLIPLEKNKVSVGAVVGLEQYKYSGKSGEEFLLEIMSSTDFLRGALSPKPELLGSVRTTGNIGYTNDKLAGNGWLLLGDAAFFVDPCYSSGVYLAMKSAEMAADVIVEGFEEDDLSPEFFSDYENELKQYESTVRNVVDIFYASSRSKVLSWIAPRLTTQSGIEKFTTFIGGDFEKNRSLIWATRKMTNMLSGIFTSLYE